MFGGAGESRNSVVNVARGIHIELPLRRGEISAGRPVKYPGRAIGRRAYAIITQDYAITSGDHLVGGLTRGLGS